MMLTRQVIASLLCLVIVSLAGAQQTRPEQTQPPPAVAASEYNVLIEPDLRTFFVMAAINVAGFEHEPGGQALSPARAELRRDLAKMDPQLREQLAAFYKSHRRAGVDEAVDALRYAALSLLMSPPPAFEIYVPMEVIPEDLRALLERNGQRSNELVRLVQEFYLKSGAKQLADKYLAIGRVYAAAYEQAASQVITEVFNYFHATPDTIVRMRPLVIESGDAGDRGGKKKQQVVTRARTRQVFIIPEPLAALSTSFVRDDLLNQKEDLLSRKIGDDYVVLIGPSRLANTDAIRQALIRFVIDPIIERHLKAALEYKEQITKLVAKVPTAPKEFGPSVYLVIRESLAQAAEARMRRLQVAEGRPPYTDDDAVFDLAQAYLRGGVLAFHFYEALIGFEKVGISIEDFFDQMVATTKFEREAERPKEFEPVVARVSAKRAAAAKATPDSSSAIDPLAQKILASDELIRQRRFSEAQVILQEVLATTPNNARALFGMAQVANHLPSSVEADPNGDENDKIQAQHDRLERALALYRRAIEAASPQTERWLIQWSHVLIARILDFQDFRADAVAEYEKAIAMGDIVNGAYREALDGKQRPYKRN